MKDALGNFIRDNREEFDDRNPPEKIWNKIAGNLPAEGRQTFLNSVGVWRAAAAIFLALSVYLFVTRDPNTLPRKEMVQAQGDFKDLESFYRGQIAEKVNLINDFDAGGENDHFTQDLKKLEAMYLLLGEEVKGVSAKKVKDAMILNLLVRIDLLNQQLQKLEDSRKKNKSNGQRVV